MYQIRPGNVQPKHYDYTNIDEYTILHMCLCIQYIYNIEQGFSVASERTAVNLMVSWSEEDLIGRGRSRLAKLINIHHG